MSNYYMYGKYLLESLIISNLNYNSSYHKSAFKIIPNINTNQLYNNQLLNIKMDIQQLQEEHFKLASILLEVQDKPTKAEVKEYQQMRTQMKKNMILHGNIISTLKEITHIDFSGHSLIDIINFLSQEDQVYINQHGVDNL